MISTTTSALRLALSHNCNPKVFFRNEREREFHAYLLENAITMHELFDRHQDEFVAFVKSLCEKELRP